MPNNAPPTSLNTDNHILNALPAADRARLATHLEPVELVHASVLQEIGEQIDHIYFPSDGMVSVVNSTSTGQSTEVGLVGSEGFSSFEALMNGREAVNRHIIQLAGRGHRIETEVLKQEFLKGGPFHLLALRFVRAMIAQISQTSLCNRLHLAEERFAKWLLLCHDRASGDVMRITQEFAAIMLGSNRTSVTLAAGELQDAGLIEYRRGKLTIVDRKGLEKVSCECYKRIRVEYQKLND